MKYSSGPRGAGLALAAQMHCCTQSYYKGLCDVIAVVPVWDQHAYDEELSQCWCKTA